MPIQANVQGFMQIAGYDPNGGGSHLALPQKRRFHGEYANAERLLGFRIDERLAPMYRQGQTTQLPDNPTLVQVEQAATAYLTTYLPGPSLWQATMVSRSHYGTPQGWTPVGTGAQVGFLFEISERVNGGATYQTVRELPATYDKEFGGDAYVQPVLSLWWS